MSRPLGSAMRDRALLETLRSLARRSKQYVRRLLSRSTPDSRDVPVFALDALDERFRRLDSLRENGNVHFSRELGAWVVVGYDETHSVFARPSLFSTQPYAAVDRVMLADDGASHAASRQIIGRHVSAETLQRLASHAERTAKSLVRPSFDAVQEYAAPLSWSIASELIGLNDETLREMLDATAKIIAPSYAEVDYGGLLDPITERTSLYPVLLRDSSGTFSAAEVRSLIRLLWLASTVTTLRAISWGVLRLLHGAALTASVASDQDRLDRFVDEILRLHPPEHMLPRYVTDSCVVGGVAVPAGSTLFVCTSAANRDPSRFDRPHELRLDRPAYRHFSFGSGIHHCLGAPLARRVIMIALRTLLTELPAMRPQGRTLRLRDVRATTYPESLRIRG